MPLEDILSFELHNQATVIITMVTDSGTEHTSLRIVRSKPASITGMHAVSGSQTQAFPKRNERQG